MMTVKTAVPVTVCDHPLVQHHLGVLRDEKTGSELFRMTLRRIAHFLIMQATHDLPLSPTTVQTPLTRTDAKALSPEVPILLVPILRAGLTLGEVALEILPMARVYHIGLYRDEETFQPVTYYNKLPNTLSYDKAQVFVLDPMLATGHSAIAAVQMIQAFGTPVENIRFVSVISAPEGIAALHQHAPDLQIYTGSIDERLNEKAYIVPGLGDAGDRTFGTV